MDGSYLDGLLPEGEDNDEECGAELQTMKKLWKTDKISGSYHAHPFCDMVSMAVMDL